MTYNNIYKSLFKSETYNLHPDNELRYVLALNFLKKFYTKGDSIIDISSGRGTLIKLLLDIYPKENIVSTDLEKFHPYEVKFIKLDLNNVQDRENFSEKHKFLFALDCLEHLDKEQIDPILKYLSSLANYSLFTIANHEEIINNIDLHRIKEDINYWTALIEKYFYINNKYTAYNNRLMVFELINNQKS